MIRVFFNIRLDEATLPERRGQWVHDAAEARAVARTIVRRLVQQHGGEPRLLNAAMVVTDEAGTCLLDLSFFEALYVPVDVPEPVAPQRGAAPDAPRPGRAAALRAAVAGRLPPAVRTRAHALVQGVSRGIAPRVADLARHWGALRALLAPGRRDPRARYRLGFEAGR